eukprot:4611574-Pleurochrysis_carterae.AAC.1
MAAQPWTNTHPVVEWRVAQSESECPCTGSGAQLVSEAHVSMVVQGGRRVSHDATEHPHGVGYVGP